VALELTDLRASEIRERGLPDLRTASLFGAPRALLVREAQELPAGAAAVLVAELDRGGPDATVLLLASGVGRIQALAKRLAAQSARVDVDVPKEWDARRWAELVADEFRRAGRSADRGAVESILNHAGLDVAAIAEKVAQAVAAAPAGRIGAATVEAVVVGHGNRGSFAVADAMCDREPAKALTLLRGALEAGDDPVLLLGALTYRLRTLVAVAGKVDAKTAGVNVSSGQLRRLHALRRNFGPGELGRAYRSLADADAEIKGGEVPPAFALERAVVAVATRS
jgi:DNA polymerase-3 subunit delta